MIPVPHTSGPPLCPTREECSVCRRLQRLITIAEEAAARESKGKTKGAYQRVAHHLNREAGYREALTEHLYSTPHRKDV
ncbi:hypothetical protein ACR820_05845 [Streptomyces netropsis]